MLLKDRTYNGIIIDLDAITQQKDWLSELAADINRLKTNDIVVRYVSKNSFLGTDQALAQLHEVGFPAESEDLFLATNVLAKEIVRRENRATVYLIGSDGLKKDLHAHGLRIIEKPEEIDYLADYVVVGLDRQFNYSKLTQALRCFDHGAQWAVTGDETIVPGHDPLLPGTGVIVAAVQVMAGRKPDLFLGKPKSHVLRHAMKSADIQPAQWTLLTDPSSPLGQAASEVDLSVLPLVSR